MADATEDAVDALEAKARELALSGNPQLLQFLLRHHRPERYGDRSWVQVDLPSQARQLAERFGVTVEDVLELVARRLGQPK